MLNILRRFSHRLQVEFDDNTTTRRNKSRQYITHVVT